MKTVLLFGLGVGLFVFSGCSAGKSVWSRDPYVPAPQTMRGSQTYSPKTVVSPYHSNGRGQFPLSTDEPIATDNFGSNSK